MVRTRIGLLIAIVVMLTGCGENAGTIGDIDSPLKQAHSSKTDLGKNNDQQDSDDIAGEIIGAEHSDEIAEEDADEGQADIQTDNSDETDGSDESDQIYFKPCNTYQDILDNAYEVITHRDADFVEADEIFSYIGIWESGLGRNTDEALAGIGYTFYDVDGNGIEELIIMDTNKESDIWDNRILTMYSLLDGKPVLVIDGWARNRYYLLNDGTFYNEGSGGAAYTIFATYRMAEDGVSIEVIDYYFSDYRDDTFKEYWLAEGNWGWFHNTTGVQKIDESEWIEFENEDVPWEMMENYIEQVKQLDLTFFETMRQ